jgi:hypothetical protein
VRVGPPNPNRKNPRSLKNLKHSIARIKKEKLVESVSSVFGF